VQECQLITGKLSNNATGYALWMQTKCCNPTHGTVSDTTICLNLEGVTGIQIYVFPLCIGRYTYTQRFTSRGISVKIKLKLYEIWKEGLMLRGHNEVSYAHL